MVPEPNIPPGLITHDNAWQYGVLGVVALLFGWVIYKLWKRGTEREDQQAKEREAREVERERIRGEHALALEKLRGDYEAKHRELSERFGQELAEQITAFRASESTIRRENSDTLEAMAEAAARQQDKQIALNEKLTERIVTASGATPKGRYGL